MEGLNTLIYTLVIGFLLAIVFGLYILFDQMNCFPKPIKSKGRPDISWELKTNGQTVDTVWIYNFNNESK